MGDRPSGEYQLFNLRLPVETLSRLHRYRDYLNVGEDRAQSDVECARDELRVADEQKARPARQREDPLPHRHLRDHSIHEMSRSVACGG